LLFRLIPLAVFLALLTSPLWLAALAVQDTPSVRNDTRLSVDDVARAKRLLAENNPRTLRDGERRAVKLSERELNLLLSYVLPDSYACKVDLAAGKARFLASLRLPDNPIGPYLNLDFDMLETTGLPSAGRLHLGHLRLPDWLLRAVAGFADLRLAARLPEYRELLESIDSVKVGENAVRVVYRWQASLAEQLQERGREFMLPPEQRRRVLYYYGTIRSAAESLPRGSSLAGIIGPLFARARDRTAAGADPVEENRALLLALGMVMQGANPDRLATDAEIPVPRVRGLRATLRGRGDLAQHFAISAALAAGGGSELADVIGVFKELSDSQGGSGFSFADLLADRAGVVLAEQALGSSAAQMQRALAGRYEESLIMPPIGQLPEGLQELEFRSRYEDLDSEAYERVSRELERRIAMLPIYR
jgi:hypothetical protein